MPHIYLGRQDLLAKLAGWKDEHQQAPLYCRDEVVLKNALAGRQKQAIYPCEFRIRRFDDYGKSNNPQCIMYV
jgi:hypothetical protein